MVSEESLYRLGSKKNIATPPCIKQRRVRYKEGDEAITIAVNQLNREKDNTGFE